MRSKKVNEMLHSINVNINIMTHLTRIKNVRLDLVYLVPRVLLIRHKIPKSYFHLLDNSNENELFE